LFIISKDENSKLTIAPDTLKKNIVKYLNPYRMISDAIDILDVKVVNIGLTFDILVDPSLNRSTILQQILSDLQKFFDIKNFNIDQPIIYSDVRNIIYSRTGVISVNNVLFENIVGIVGDRTYSDATFDVAANTKQGLIFPPSGGLFEIRYPEFDIIGRAIA